MALAFLLRLLFHISKILPVNLENANIKSIRLIYFSIIYFLTKYTRSEKCASRSFSMKMPSILLSKGITTGKLFQFVYRAPA